MRAKAILYTIILLVVFVYVQQGFAQEPLLYHLKCMEKYAQALDDGISDAKTIAELIVWACAEDAKRDKMKYPFYSSKEIESRQALLSVINARFAKNKINELKKIPCKCN